MKTFDRFIIKIASVLAACAMLPAMAFAQNYYKNYYVNGDWQFNIPLNNDFADKGSGWGMSFEGGYYFTPKLGMGLFMAYSSNHKYIPTETFTLDNNATITTNQQHSMFQLPFGVSMRYRVMPDADMFDPYIGFKLGAEYCQISSYVSTFQIYDRNWGFYMSPEVGSNFWLTPEKNVGLHLSIYYSFSTNKGTVLNGDIDKLNNLGFRVGLAF